MRTTTLLFIYLFLTSTLIGQESLENLFLKENNFHQITKNVDAYFQKKHPGKSVNDLSTGENRDGKFVKYMRWKSFWKNHLNEDGTIGDLSKYGRQQANAKQNNGFYNDIQWSNISNSNYITGQISLGRTTSVAFHPTDPNIFYVGAPIGGIWKTTDGGQSYTPLGDELPYLSVSSIIVDKNNPTNIYIAVSDHVWYGPPSIGVYKSIDGGNTWSPTALSFQFTDNIRIFAMAADPNDSQKMYVACASGLFETTDGFNTVVQSSILSCYDVQYKPNDSNTIYVGTNDGKVLKSINAGGSFIEVTDFGNGSVKLGVTVANDQLLAARNGNNLHQSIDSGNTFSSTNVLPENNTMISYSASNPNIILSGNFEIYRSDDGGTNFTQITQWLGNNGLPLIHVDQRNVFINPLQNNYIYFCNDGGLYRYDINMAQFEDLSDGLQITQYYDIAVAQTDINVISGGSQDNGSMFRNSAGIWQELAATGDGMNTEIDPTNENIIYWEYQNGSMQRRTNGSTNGISPPGQAGQGAWETPFRLDPSNPDRIIAGYDEVYESLDKGNNWTSISTPLAGGTDLNEIAISKSNSNRIYATQGSTLYVKSTSGNTWTTKTTPATNSISAIRVDPNDMDIIYITNSGYSNGNKVFKSDDAGNNWTNISYGLPNIPTEAIALYEDLPNAIFIGTDYGVYYLDDNLSDWERYGNMPNTRVTDIDIHYGQQIIRAGTHGRGVLEAPIDVALCPPNAPDQDNDGICDAVDACPFMHSNMIGTSCDDGDPFSSGESYSVNCICEGGSSNINSCTATGAGGTGGDWINLVSLNTIVNASAKTAYSDFRNISTEIKDGESYTLTIGLNFSFPLDVALAWIDFNRDGTFDPSEEITMSGFDSNHKSTGTVVVPSGMTYGMTTLRVRNIYADPAPSDPCNSYFGEVEDYSINFIDACPFDNSIIGLNYFANDIISEQVENQITANNIFIQSGANVIYEAGDAIELLNEFEIKIGATFEAAIGGCID